MSIQLTCPAGHLLKVADAWAGRVGRCPVCKAVVNVPAAAEPAARPDMASDARPAENANLAPPPTTANEPPRALIAVEHAEPQAQRETDAVGQAPTIPPMIAAGVPHASASPTAAGVPNEPPAPVPPVLTATQQAPAEAPPLPWAAAETRHEKKPIREAAIEGSIAARLARQAHASRRRAQYALATGAAGLALFCMIPALPHRNLAMAPAWARIALLMGTLQIAYAIWAMTIPDRSAVRVLMMALTAVAAAYATTLTVALTTPASDSLPLDLTDMRKQAAAWCAAVMLLASLLAYACGRAGWSRS
jgi:hypothetical protein